MKKTIRECNGETLYFLGVSKNGDKVYLNNPEWSCNWYWGIGYIKEFTPHAKNWNCHTHFDTLFLKGNCWKLFNDYFSETVLTDREKWQLLEYMKTLYTLREFSDMLHTKGSHITANAYISGVLGEEIDGGFKKRINEVLIPGLWEEIKQLLTI